MSRQNLGEKASISSIYLKNRLKKAAKERGLNLSALVNDLLEANLFGNLDLDTIRDENKLKELAAKKAEIESQLTAIGQEKTRKQELQGLITANFGKEGETYFRDSIAILKSISDPIQQRQVAIVRSETLKHYGRIETTEDLLYLALKENQRKEIS